MAYIIGFQFIKLTTLLIHIFQNSSVNISNGTTNNNRYISELSLKNANYLDTGYYYCDPISVVKKEDKNISNNSIYLYVQRKYFK